MKLKKLIMPAVFCSALATVTPFIVTSCNKQDTKIVQYTVDRNYDCIYGLNKNKERIALSKQQLAALEGCFLITKRGMTAYILVDKNGHGSDGNEYPNTVKGFIEYASSKHYMEFELFLINGKYDLDSVTIPTGGSHPAFWLNGLMGYDNEMLTELDVAPGHNWGEIPSGTTNLGDLPSVSLRTLKIIGSARIGQDWTITGATKFDVEWSYLYGENIFTAPTCAFESTYFNSTPVTVEGGHTEYALWLKNTYTATFTDCHFYSRGKAIKVYLPASSSPISTYYLLDAIDAHIPYYVAGEEADEQNKFVFEINNVNGGYTESNKMDVWVNKTDIIGDIDRTEQGLQPHFWHGGIVGSLDEEEYDPELTEIHPTMR